MKKSEFSGVASNGRVDLTSQTAPLLFLVVLDKLITNIINKYIVLSTCLCKLVYSDLWNYRYGVSLGGIIFFYFYFIWGGRAAFATSCLSPCVHLRPTLLYHTGGIKKINFYIIREAVVPLCLGHTIITTWQLTNFFTPHYFLLNFSIVILISSNKKYGATIIPAITIGIQKKKFKSFGCQTINIMI